MDWRSVLGLPDAASDEAVVRAFLSQSSELSDDECATWLMLLETAERVWDSACDAEFASYLAASGALRDGGLARWVEAIGGDEVQGLHEVQEYLSERVLRAAGVPVTPQIFGWPDPWRLAAGGFGGEGPGEFVFYVGASNRALVLFSRAPVVGEEAAVQRGLQVLKQADPADLTAKWDVHGYRWHAPGFMSGDSFASEDTALRIGRQHIKQARELAIALAR